MRAIAIGLDLEDHFFDEKIDEKCHNLRLLSYPAIKTDVLKDDSQARAGAHSGALYQFVMCSVLAHTN
jgi:isopenicillin N synthase-like dioxygenase